MLSHVRCTHVLCTHVHCTHVHCTHVLCTHVLCTHVLCTHVLCTHVHWAITVRLPYATPGCSRFLGRSEHTCGTRAQQEDCSGIWTHNTSVSRGQGSITKPSPTPLQDHLQLGFRWPDIYKHQLTQQHHKRSGQTIHIIVIGNTTTYEIDQRRYNDTRMSVTSSVYSNSR